MHKLVHAWGHDRLAVKARAKYGAAALECLTTTDLQRDSDPVVRARLAPHIMANFSTIPGWFDAMDDAKESTLERVVVVADCLKGAGLYESEKNLRMFEHEKREDLSPSGDPKLLRATNELALVLQAQGDHKAAEELHRRALEGYEKVLGKEHPFTLSSVNNLATVLQAQGDHKAAEELHRRALEGREKVLGTEHPDTLTSVWFLAALMKDVGRRSEAVLLYEHAVTSFGAALGSEYPTTVRCKRSLR
jgi:tetratricopeptide (TPR) repeat protein